MDMPEGLMDREDADKDGIASEVTGDNQIRNKEEGDGVRNAHPGDTCP